MNDAPLAFNSIFWWGLFLFVPTSVHADCARAEDGGIWLEAAHVQYSICYTSECANDVEFVRIWLDRTEQLMLDKYGLDRHGYQMSVYLHPVPTSRAGVGLATNICCSGNAGEIHYLTPSAPAWEEGRSRGSTTSLGQPFDDHYHAKTLVHEYITQAHARISADKTRGFKYYSAPSSFHQGLEEYDGMFHSTEFNRTTTYRRLLDYADERLRDKVYCCRTLASTQALGTTDAYNGGALLMKFLADQFGEGLHLDLLKSGRPTFEAALVDELSSRGLTVPEAFDDLQAWLDEKTMTR